MRERWLLLLVSFTVSILAIVTGVLGNVVASYLPPDWQKHSEIVWGSFLVLCIIYLLGSLYIFNKMLPVETSSNPPPRNSAIPTPQQLHDQQRKRELETQYHNVSQRIETLRQEHNRLGPGSLKEEAAANLARLEQARDEIVRVLTVQATLASSPLGSAAPSTAASSISPHRIDGRNIADSTQQLTTFRQSLALYGEPIGREALEEITTVATTRALVILYGPGGTGKSVALWQWLREHGSFVAIETIRHVPPRFLADQVCNWLGLPETHPWRKDPIADEALAQLYADNPTAQPPIIYFGIDGFDERTNISTERQDNVQSVLNWFWDEDQRCQERTAPRAVLVITCCNLDEFLRRWLPTNMTYINPAVQPGRLALIEWRNFSPDELLTAARRVPPAIYRRLLSGTNPGPPGIMPRGNLVPSSLPVDPTIKTSLLHPAMWQAFLTLAPTTQHRVLDGVANDELAAPFVNWFFERAIRRRDSFPQETMWHLLSLVAQHCSTINREYYDRIDDWITPARATINDTDVGIRYAELLYDEAVAAGLLELHGRDIWSWQHPFLCDYLASTEQRGGSSNDGPC